MKFEGYVAKEWTVKMASPKLAGSLTSLLAKDDPEYDYRIHWFHAYWVVYVTCCSVEFAVMSQFDNLAVAFLCKLVKLDR